MFDKTNISPLDQFIDSKIGDIVSQVVSQLEERLTQKNDVNELEQLRTNKEVLNRYSISYSTLKKLRDQDLPAYKIGSDYRYKYSELDEYFRIR